MTQQKSHERATRRCLNGTKQRSAADASNYADAGLPPDAIANANPSTTACPLASASPTALPVIMHDPLKRAPSPSTYPTGWQCLEPLAARRSCHTPVLPEVDPERPPGYVRLLLSQAMQRSGRNPTAAMAFTACLGTAMGDCIGLKRPMAKCRSPLTCLQADTKQLLPPRRHGPSRPTDHQSNPGYYFAEEGGSFPINHRDGSHTNRMETAAVL